MGELTAIILSGGVKSNFIGEISLSPYLLRLSPSLQSKTLTFPPILKTMALSTIKFSELPFSKPIIPICFRFRFKLSSSLSSSSSSSVRISDQNPNPCPNPNPKIPPKSPSAPWLSQWDPPRPPSSSEKPKISSSIERIVHRLRTLELDEDEQNDEFNQFKPLNGDERLGDLLERNWTRPDLPSGFHRAAPLPWERGGNENVSEEKETGKRRRVRAPTLAELTIDDEELRRLRRLGMTLRERVSVPKAGVTQAVLDNIHKFWRRSEIVRLKFHEDLAHDMKMAHEIVEVRGDW